MVHGEKLGESPALPSEAKKVTEKGMALLTKWGVPLAGGAIGFLWGYTVFRGPVKWLQDYIWSVGQGATEGWGSWAAEIGIMIVFLIVLVVGMAIWKMSGDSWIMKGIAAFFCGCALRIGIATAQVLVIAGPGPNVSEPRGW